MSGLPRISGRECIRALVKAGFYIKRQEGSYIILRRDESFAQLVVPDHQELDRAHFAQLSGKLVLAWMLLPGWFSLFWH